jgi:3-methyladenine DNA glycosylase Mpg
VVVTPRVNVAYAGPRWAARRWRWRFLLADSDWVSGPDRRRRALPPRR